MLFVKLISLFGNNVSFHKRNTEKQNNSIYNMQNVGEIRKLSIFFESILLFLC